MEVVEGALVAIAGFPGEPVGHGEVSRGLGPIHGFSDALVRLVLGQARAESQAREDGRVVAHPHGLEPVAEGETVDAGGRREPRGAQFAPVPRLAVALKGVARHPKECLSQERPAEARHDLIIDGGRSGLSERLPDIACREGIAKRLPKIETG